MPRFLSVSLVYFPHKINEDIYKYKNFTYFGVFVYPQKGSVAFEPDMFLFSV
jgi:hypothetical protein